jgi:hypothetical protein
MKIIPEYVRRDVAKVKAEALAVIKIKPGGGVAARINLHGRLGVLAVVGPTDDEDGNHYPEALLLEVALCKTRPYVPTLGLRRTHWSTLRRRRVKRRKIHRRRPYFSLTEEQYRLVSPLIFRTIQELVDRRLATWLGGNFYGYYTIALRRSTENARKRNNGSSFVRYRSIPCGLLIRIPSQFKKLFLADLHWIELHNGTVQNLIQNFAFWMRQRVREYEDGFRVKNFRKLVGFRSLKRLLESRTLPFRFKVEALDKLPGGKRYPLRREIAELLDWPDNGDTPHWRVLASQAIQPRVRLQRICARIKKTSGRYINCEFFAHDLSRFTKSSRRTIKYDDNVPF